MKYIVTVEVMTLLPRPGFAAAGALCLDVDECSAQAGVCAQGTLDRGGKLFDKYLAAKINPGERASI